MRVRPIHTSILTKGLCLAMATTMVVPPNLLFAQDAKAPVKAGAPGLEAEVEPTATTLDLSGVDALEIDPRTGGLKHVRTDLIVGEGEMAFAITRTYKPWAGDLLNHGTHWVSSLDMHLDVQKDGMRAALVHEDGYRTWFRRDPKGELVATRGRMAKLEVLKDGFVVRGLGDERIYHFDKEGWIQSRQGPGSLRIEFKYAEGHRLSQIEGPWGTIEVERNKAGALTAIRAPGRRSVRYTQDKQGNLTRIERGDLFETYGYDSAGRISWLAGGKAIVQYDILGRAIALRGAATKPVRVRYAQSSHKTWAREATVSCGDQTERFQFSRDGRTVKKTDALGGTTTTVIDQRSRLIKLVAPDGRVMTQTYDARGRIATRTTPQGTTTYEYTSTFTERPTGITLVDGRKVGFTYDLRGNLTEVVAPGGATQRYEYDAFGRVKTIVDARGTKTEIVRDKRGFVLEQTEEGVGTTHFLRNQHGDILKVKRPDGRLVTITRDALGRGVKVTDAKGSVWEVDYDARGNVVRYLDEHGQAFAYTYDDRGHLGQVTRNSSPFLSFKHDAAGEVSAITDANGNTTTIERVNARTVKVTSPTTGTKIVERDTAGRLLKETLGTSVIQYGYDDRGRLVTRSTPQGVDRYRYDQYDRTVELKGPQGGYSLAYDKVGRLAKLTNLALKKTVAYEYTAAGDRAATILPWGKVAYQYDAQGRLIGLDLPDGKSIAIELHPDGRRKEIRYPSGVKTRFVYKRSRLKAVLTSDAKGVELDRRVYGYDAKGRVSWIAGRDRKRTHYTHDADGRITKAVAPTGEVTTYGYDKAGNRISETRGGKTTTTTIGAGNRAVARSGAETESIAWSDTGALASRTQGGKTTRYVYDHDQNLVKVEQPDGKVVTYGYAPNGARMWRQVGKTRTDFLHDLDDVVGEYTGKTLQTGFVHGQGEDDVLAAKRGKDWFFYHYDLVRSVTSLTNGKGKVAARYTYDPFGKASAATGAAAAWNPYRYTSRAFDGNTGLYHYRARAYAPDLGRFTSPDPAGLAGGVNLYTYVENNPLMFNDPQGLWPKWLDRAWEGTKNGVSSAASWTYKKVLTPVGKAVAYTANQTYHFGKGFVKGTVGAVKGIYQMVRHPILTAKTLYRVLEDPEFRAEIKEALGAKWEEYKDAAVNDPERFAEMTGYLTAEILTAVVGTKGLGTIAKTATVAKVGNKVATVARVAASPVTRTASRAGGAIATRFPRVANVGRRAAVLNRARNIELARRAAAGGNIVRRTGRRVVNVGRDVGSAVRHAVRRPGPFVIYSGMRMSKSMGGLVAATGRGLWKATSKGSLYVRIPFEDAISDAVNKYENHQAAVKAVRTSASDLLRNGANMSEAELAKALEEVGSTYTGFRNRLMKPVHDEDKRLDAKLADLDKKVESGEVSDDELDSRLAALLEEYGRRRHNHLVELYDRHREADHDMTNPSPNRTISFQDEIDLLEALKKKTNDPKKIALIDARIADLKATMEYEYQLFRQGDHDILIAGIAGAPRAPGEAPVDPSALGGGDDLGMDGLGFDSGILDRVEGLDLDQD